MEDMETGKTFGLLSAEGTGKLRASVDKRENEKRRKFAQQQAMLK
jgi:hypothetical protein